MADTLQGLNKTQREVVTSTESFIIRAIARASSGKAHALLHRLTTPFLKFRKH